MKTMTFEFMDKNTGEQFFVEANDTGKAINIAKQYFKSPYLCDVYDNDNERDMFIVESMGYDTY